MKARKLAPLQRDEPNAKTHQLRVVGEAAAVVSFNEVSKSFQTDSGKIEALRNINLKIAPKEFLCIVGPSGCGKSTLLNLVAGLDSPDSGTILLNGTPVNGTSPDRLVIFQEGALFPWLTVKGNIEFGLKIKGISKSEREVKVNEALDLVGLRKFSMAYPHQLSGGMKQRTAIARGLVLEPQILLMDEPFAALDAQTRELLYEELQIIWERTEKTIMFVTHNIREAACLADRIILMSPHPGQTHQEYDVKQNRPRVIEDEKVMEVARAISADLKKLTSIHGDK